MGNGRRAITVMRWVVALVAALAVAAIVFLLVVGEGG
jgi:hypothetical protein